MPRPHSLKGEKGSGENGQDPWAITSCSLYLATCMYGMQLVGREAGETSVSL